MKKYIFAVLLGLFTVISCEDMNFPTPDDSPIEPADTTDTPKPVEPDVDLTTFECTFPEGISGIPETVSVFTTSGKVTVLDSVSVSSNGAVYSFTGDVPESEGYLAIAPAIDGSSAWASSLKSEYTFPIPSGQTAFENGNDPEASVYIGEAEQGRISFTEATASIRFSIKGEGVSNVRLDAQEKREGCTSGLASLSVSGGEISVLADRQESCSYVNLEGEFISGSSYGISVFPGTYGNIVFTVTDSTGTDHSFSIEDEISVGSGESIFAAELSIEEDPGPGPEPEKDPYVVIASEVFVSADGVEDEPIDILLEGAENWSVNVSYEGCVTYAYYSFIDECIMYTVPENPGTEESTGTILFSLSREGREDMVFDIAVAQEGKEIVVPSGEEKYLRLTGTPDSWEGRYVIICTKEMLIATGEISSDGWLKAEGISLESDGSIARSEETIAKEITIESFNGGYSVRFANGQYLGSTDDNGGIHTTGSTDQNSKLYTWNFSMNGNDFSMFLPNVNKRSLRYNSRGFRTYTGTTGSAVILFRYGGSSAGSASVTTSSTVSSKTETSACIKGSYRCPGQVPSRIGFKYGTSRTSMPYTVYAETPSGESGEFSVTLSGLSPGTNYCYQAFLVVDYKTCGGAVCSFTTEGQVYVDPNLKADYGWFELPAQKDHDRNGIDDENPDYYYSHTFRADAPGIRNFSCCYSKSRIHPVWVAAPMHRSYKGDSGRNDSYKSDPKIYCTQNGKFSGYTRGHLLGSSDRTISKDTNRQVFYYSNIGAQTQSGFNTGGGAWNNLEDFTDGQWCTDTLYQVIGCIFESFTDRYGSTVHPTTASGSQIPTAYYKVLLRTKKGNTGKKVSECTADELKCAAFILKHESNAGHRPCNKDLYTVEDVERMTGLTFFVNVPNAPKGEANASDWGL